MFNTETAERNIRQPNIYLMNLKSSRNIIKIKISRRVKNNMDEENKIIFSILFKNKVAI
jgi:hypothetical protein